MRATLALALLLAFAAPAAAQQFDPAYEERNQKKSEERGKYETSDPSFRRRLEQKSAEEQQKLYTTLAADPERNPLQNACGTFRLGPCLGDVRLHDWEQNGHGLVRPVLFGARSGATLSGHVWATKAGPARRPAIVFITGSIQVPEMVYWFAATTLAKHGFVVLTFDVQGQGLSDTYGEPPDQNENVPSQNPTTFLDGAEDALDFLLSTPARPYRPRRSCTSGTDHSPKHLRRVGERRNAPFNPLHHLIDPDRVGIAGQSLGATASSFVGQADPRVDAIVGFDNLGPPTTGVPCSSAPQTRAVPKISKPGLGISNDYFITPQPYRSLPDPEGKLSAFKAYRKAGVDSAQFNIRGGTHEETAFIPDLTPATLRGVDLASWYLAAWFDKYLNRDPSADRRLLSRRWTSDARDREVDPPGKGNLYSDYFRSRVDIGLPFGGRASCSDVQRGDCPALVSDDCEPPNFRYLTLALTRDAGMPAGTCATSAGRPSIRQRVRIHAPRLASDAGPTRRFRVRVRARGGFPKEIARYRLEVRRGKRWRAVRSRRSRSGRFRFRGRPGRSYRFRARAVDRLGGVGPWTHARTVVPLDVRPRVAAARFAGDWKRVRARRAWGRTLYVSTRPGGRLRLRVRGSRLYLVGRRARGGGRARVRVDRGVRRTVSMRSRRTRQRRVLVALRVRRGRHTITIEHAGGGPIAIDAIGAR